MGQWQLLFSVFCFALAAIHMMYVVMRWVTKTEGLPAALLVFANHPLTVTPQSSASVLLIEGACMSLAPALLLRGQQGKMTIAAVFTISLSHIGLWYMSTWGMS